jgi:hypothetical protein
MRGLMLIALLVVSPFGCASRPTNATMNVLVTSGATSGAVTSVGQQVIQDALQTAELKSFEAFTRYASLDLPWDSFNELRQQIDTVDRQGHAPLRHRGEAHITWITPPEFQVLLRDLKPSVIESILRQHLFDVRNSLRALCLGRFQGADSETWFVVVESAALIQARVAIQQAFIAQGGSSALFEPKTYHPHVTLGFAPRDLHAQDGAIKDSRSCHRPL